MCAITWGVAQIRAGDVDGGTATLKQVKAAGLTTLTKYWPLFARPASAPAPAASQ